MKWIESQMGYLKVDNSGNVVAKHPYKYCEAGGKRFKVKLNPDGSEAGIEEVENCCFLYVHPTTGEILGSSGLAFYLSHELDGTLPQKVTGADGVEAEIIKVPASEICPHCGKVENLPLNQVLPPDFTAEVEVDEIDEVGQLIGKKKVSRIGYRWNRIEGKIEKLSPEEITRPVKARGFSAPRNERDVRDPR